MEEKRIELQVKRLDLIHDEVQGNKFFKLKYNLEKAKSEGHSTILTFGGAFSNHIYATAKAAEAEGFTAIGLIRGEPMDPLNHTLDQAEKSGMALHFIDRTSYRRKAEVDFIEDLHQKFGSFYLIPEGGTNQLAIQGSSEILMETDRKSTHICTSIGTGGTFAGLANSVHQNQNLLGFSSLKGDFIHSEIQNILTQHQLNPKVAYQTFDQFHFGGYGKYNQSLIEFIWWFFETFGIILDPIYTGKMAFGIWDLIGKNYFSDGSKILMIHSGGLQGNIGFTERTGIDLPSKAPRPPRDLQSRG